ncbi:hypothetical protein M3J09_007148 [Ascochyta lentis]
MAATSGRQGRAAQGRTEKNRAEQPAVGLRSAPRRKIRRYQPPGCARTPLPQPKAASQPSSIVPAAGVRKTKDGRTGHTAPHRPIARRASVSPNNARVEQGPQHRRKETLLPQFFGKTRQLAQLRNLFLFHPKPPSPANPPKLPSSDCLHPGTAPIRPSLLISLLN